MGGFCRHTAGGELGNRCRLLDLEPCRMSERERGHVTCPVAREAFRKFPGAKKETRMDRFVKEFDAVYIAARRFVACYDRWIKGEDTARVVGMAWKDLEDTFKRYPPEGPPEGGI